MSKVVFITGGACGIGKAIALELAKNKYDIVINYLTSKQAGSIGGEMVKKMIMKQEEQMK